MLVLYNSRPKPFCSNYYCYFLMDLKAERLKNTRLKKRLEKRRENNALIVLENECFGKNILFFCLSGWSVAQWVGTTAV